MPKRKGTISDQELRALKLVRLK